MTLPGIGVGQIPKARKAPADLIFGVFWLGALMRSVGAIVLGAYIDQIGRRQGRSLRFRSWRYRDELAMMLTGNIIS
ncbi:hypothetical protein FXB40_25470 [Bradyrhizobium rifense]|uniref:MFS transporter n=1 Tax=Bradyrhizobium rifense TaxID=515499 RepID=A0A5D3KBU8_9BRAD|nr:hypothetical protein FXB40_25470 [Bradyrhizobium rifense]